VWKPPWARYVADLAVGRSWSYDTHLMGWMPPASGHNAPGTTFDMHLKGTRRVTGTQVVAVAGQPVPIWTIEIDETLVMPLVGLTTTLRTVATEQLAPSIGVPVTRHEVVTRTNERVVPVTGHEPDTGSNERVERSLSLGVLSGRRLERRRRRGCRSLR